MGGVNLNKCLEIQCVSKHIVGIACQLLQNANISMCMLDCQQSTAGEVEIQMMHTLIDICQTNHPFVIGGMCI